MSIGVQNIEVHPDWNITSESFDADLAVLTLTDDVCFGRYIQPICLIDPDSDVGNIQKGYVAGYGKSEDETKIVENVLKFVETPIARSNEECFQTNHYLAQISSSRTFCGGNRDGSGVCSGDGGGGMVVTRDNTYYLRGITSASLMNVYNGCDVNNYAIFTDVIKFEDWIDEKINSNGDGYTYK